jgi:hypothetical protein
MNVRRLLSASLLIGLSVAAVRAEAAEPPPILAQLLATGSRALRRRLLLRDQYALKRTVAGSSRRLRLRHSARQPAPVHRRQAVARDLLETAGSDARLW